MWTFTSIFNTANRWLWQQGGKRKVEEGHWYTHIMRKVNVKEWERTHALWCKGYGRVKLGPTQPPPPTASLMLQPPGHETSRELGIERPGDSSAAMKPAGSGNSPLSSKKMYVALGGAGGKVTSRDPGEIKTNRLGGAHQSAFSDSAG